MSDHTWTREHAAAFAAGGLSADEAERLEAHVRDCPACAAAVSAARDLDRGLGALFAADRPGPALEDRAVRSFREGRRRRRVLTGWPKRLAAGVAATVGLTLTGYAVTRVGGPDGFPVPGVRGLAELPDMLYAGKLSGGPVPISPVSGLDASDSMPVTEGYQMHEGLVRQLSVQQQATQGVPSASALAQQLNDRITLQRYTENLAQADPRVLNRSYSELLNEDVGLQSDLMSAIPNIERQDKQDDSGRAPPSFAWYDSPDSGNSQRGWGRNQSGAARPNDFSLEYGFSLDGRQLAMGDGSVRGLGTDSHSSVAHNFTPPVYWNGTTPTNGTASKLFFNPITARPAVATQGQPAGGSGKDEKAPPDPVRAVVVNPPNATQPPKPPAPAAPDPARRVVLRSGEVEFEVESFDPAVAAVTKLVAAIPGGFVSTVNSDKLANGKVKGSVTVRVPPEHLDGLVLDLRKELGKAGELKGQKIGSSDITKQYVDLEARLKAARTMEQEILKIITDNKGDIKALVEAQKELGVWRTKVEELEGELRYYANLAALSTLTVTLAEKEIRAAVGITESERVQAGVEVEDVDKAYRDALAAVAEAKGRVTKSELKQLAAGQFNATLHFEVSPEAAGPMRDRLRQLGRVARLEIDRVQQAEGTVPKDARVKRGDTVFLVQLYNLANVAPRETATLTVATTDVPTAYAALRDAVVKAGGRVFTAQLNEGDRSNVSAQVDFEVKRPHEGEVAAALAAAGEVVSRQVTRAPESDSVTDTKLLYRATLLSAARLRPRETTTLAVEVEDVAAAVAVFGAQVAEVKGRAVDSQVAHESNGRTTAKVVYEVPLAAAGGLVEKFKSAGIVRVYQSARDPHVPDTRFATARLEVTVSNSDRIVGENAGVWPQVRRGLRYSASVLLTSVTWVVFGLCVVLPWALVGYGGYRLVRRGRRGGAVAPAP